MMHESTQTSPSIAREAKVLTQSLKDSLKRHEPWDREIEFQRANLRRQYLQLIFVHPYAKESKDADHSLWMTTSYYNIAAYKQRIAAADAVMHQSGSDNHSHGRGHHQQNGHHSKPPGVVEHRKLVQRFRQFLAEEEKFWTNLIVRVVRVFDLDEAQPALSALGILVFEPSGTETSPGRADRRNVFPSEDATIAPSQNQKEQKLVMLSKALVCLGDIARYREHYNDGGGRPRAGKDFHDDSMTVSRGRAGRRGAVEQAPRPRNYSKAQDCYERARLLVPDVGNACHQLAILASYQQDPFASVLQYYRAMCVKHPYETAAANLDSTLCRNLEGYRIALAKLEGASGEILQSPKMKVERFKKSLVALHGLWKLEPARAEIYLPGHAASVITTFSALVSERVLPTDIIWKTLILGLGALWRFRILRDPNARLEGKRGLAVEACILAHIVNIMQTLFQIGGVQLTDASITPEPAINKTLSGVGEVQTDLAQNITAVFRRTLPALRIGSKWLSVHYDYLSEAVSRLGSETYVDIPSLLGEFWASYDAFSNLLGKTFPFERLPKLTVPLEEDVDVSGFAPLKRAMFNPRTSTANGLEAGQSQVHPNEEQLMRIADLLKDAIILSEVTNSFVGFTADNFRPEPEPNEIPGGAITNSSPSLGATTIRPFALIPLVGDAENLGRNMGSDEHVNSEADDDNATVSTRTDDDPVNLAMTAILPSDDDDEMEQVVYPKQPMGPPTTTTTVVDSFSTPSARSKPLTPTKGLTAEDLVNEMTRRSSDADTSLSRALPPVSPLPPPLLFGPGSPSAPTSIWSTTSYDSASLSAKNLRVQGYPGTQARVSPPSMQTYTSGLGQNPSLLSTTPTRAAYVHQRQQSQPLAYPPGPLPHQGQWTSQPSSHFTMSQSSSQLRHTLSPASASFALQQPMVNARNFGRVPSPPYHQNQQQQQQQASLLSSGQQNQYSRHVQSFTPQQIHTPPVSSTMPSRLLPQSTWSYSGEGSLTAIGAPLGRFASDLSYSQSRIQQQAQMQRSDTWTAG